MTANSRSTVQTLARLLAIVALLYIFLVSIGLIGTAFKLFGKGFAQTLLTTTSNPIVGLFIGILATVLVQSSSTSTSIVVGLVAGGGLTVAGAIPIIMGANIGTSVTNTIVSVGHIGRPLEYRRAFAAATVHDFFNVIAVAVFLTLELLFHPLEKMARMLGDFFAGMGGLKLASPIKLATKPLINALANSVGDHVWILLVVAFILMFGALTLLIKVLRGLVLSRIEGMFSRTVFKTALRAMALGLVVTVAVQSSSIATSVIIPLAAAGVLTLEQVFPYTLGSNVGTTVTAILASLATGELAAVVVALVHLLFNIFGIVLIWPIRRIPLMLATRLAQLTLRSRLVPILYIVVVFFLVPLLIYLMMT